MKDRPSITEEDDKRNKEIPDICLGRTAVHYLMNLFVNLRKEFLIMKDKPIKQPWPRSAKITVWVMGIIIAVSVVVSIIAITQGNDMWEKWWRASSIVY